jgi:pimeloyl-ACP methyl ester carboxylesterase
MQQAKWWAGVGIATGTLGAGLALWSAVAAKGAEKMVPPDGAFIDVEGARIHYIDRGGGPVILLVHGLMGQLRNFSYALVDLLARDHRVIAIDRPGWGYSTFTGPQRPGIAEQARIVTRFADVLALDKPLLVGHSLGGAVALAAGIAAPERFSGLALIAPLTQPMDTPPPQFNGLMAPPALRGVTSWTVAAPAAILTGAATAAAIFAPDPVPADFPIRGGGALAVRPASYRAGSFELAMASDEMAALAPRYGAIKLPVHILYGRGDAVLDPTLHGERTAAAIPGAQLQLMDGGHMLPVTYPKETADFLRRAISSS